MAKGGFGGGYGLATCGLTDDVKGLISKKPEDNAFPSSLTSMTSPGSALQT